MTPAILLNCLRHSFLKLNLIKVLIMDECHHARGKHPYACIMTVSVISSPFFFLYWFVPLNFFLILIIICEKETELDLFDFPDKIHKWRCFWIKFRLFNVQLLQCNYHSNNTRITVCRIWIIMICRMSNDFFNNML